MKKAKAVAPSLNIGIWSIGVVGFKPGATQHRLRRIFPEAIVFFAFPAHEEDRASFAFNAAEVVAAVADAVGKWIHAAKLAQFPYFWSDHLRKPAGTFVVDQATTCFSGRRT